MADRAEVLRYLGYNGQEMDGRMSALIDECMEECEGAARPNYLWRVFPVTADPETPCITLDGAGLRLPGRDIFAHLEKAEQCAVMAATLGVGVDSLIRSHQARDLTRSLVLEAAAAALIEEICDRAEAEIHAFAAGEGYDTNFRFSPGYGDLPLTLQTPITTLLDTGRRIGLYCSELNLLMPRKSVTAFIGFLPAGAVSDGPHGCESCNLRDTCEFRKRGKRCGR